MLIILLSWLIITAVIYPIGFCFNNWLSRRFTSQPTETTNFTLDCLSGMMAASVLSTILALIMPLNLLANCILLLLSAVICVLRNKAVYHSIKRHYTNLKSTRPAVIFIFIAFSLIIANLSFQPSSHYDDGLYYSSTIKWLQEYGTVKGIANLNARIGFNSSWHILQALFGFSFLKWGLFNDLNGLIYLYILLFSLGGLNRLINKDSSFPVLLQTLFFLPALAFHYGASSDLALFNVNYLSSSTPDLPVSMMLWLLFVLFIVQKDKSHEGVNLVDLLILVYTVWIITIKLSAAPVVLLSLYILYKLLKYKKYSVISTLCGICMLLLCPWLIRNILLTGYLIFPFSAIDVFPVDWKVGIGTVRWLENAIKAFAVGADLNVQFQLKINDWFLPWFNRQPYKNHVVLFTAAFATIVYAVLAILTPFIKKPALTNYTPIITKRFIIANLALMISIIFWFTKSPDFRFGYGFLCIYCITFIGFSLAYFLESNCNYIRFPYYIFVVYLVTNHYVSTWNFDTFVKPPLAYRLPVNPYVRVINGIPITIVRQDDSWNAKLPVANELDFNFSNCSPRGRTIGSGFRQNPKNQSHDE